MLEDLLVPIVLFISSAIVVIRFVESRHRERMALIDRGMNSEQLFGRKKPQVAGAGSLKWGLLAFFAGLGFIIGPIFAPYSLLTAEQLSGAVAVIGGGVGLVLFYIFTRERATQRETAV